MRNSEYKHGVCTTNKSAYEVLKWTRAIKILQQNEQCRESICHFFVSNTKYSKNHIVSFNVCIMYLLLQLKQNGVRVNAVFCRKYASLPKQLAYSANTYVTCYSSSVQNVSAIDWETSMENDFQKICIFHSHQT
jgi:hypothetical protein